MVKESKTMRRPSRQVLEAISDGLDEIEAQFDLSGFSPSAVESVGDKAPVEGAAPIADGTEEADEDEAEDDSDENYDGEYFDREEIEVAIDAFISSLIGYGVIRKRKGGKLPSFAEVFEKFFGQDHEITEKANDFEDLIEGYFGWVSPEDMRSAHNAFVEIQDILRQATKEVSDAAK